MATSILTTFDRDLLLDLRIGRRLPRLPAPAVQESLQYMRALGLIIALVGGWRVTEAGRRESVELWRGEAARSREVDGGSIAGVQMTPVRTACK